MPTEYTSGIDPKEFLASTRRALDRAYSVCRKAVALKIHPNDREDVVQEAMMSVVKSVQEGTYDASRAPPEKLVNRIVYARVNDFLRSLYRKKEVPYTPEHEQIAPQPSPLEALASQEEKQIIKNTINASPHRKILHDTYIEGLSNTEVSKKRMIPLGTVKTQIRRSKPALQKKLYHLQKG